MKDISAQNTLPFLPFEDLQSGLSVDRLGDFKGMVADTLRAPNLIYEQKRDALAGIARAAMPYPTMTQENRELVEKGVICMLSEGAAPFHPRYVAPDYARLLQQGCRFLELPPAQDLFDAAAHLLTAYKYVPCGGLPVFIGRMDELFEPYIDSVTPESAFRILRSFWLMVDRLHPSAFVHATLGPQESRTGRMLLEIDRELKTLTNLTLRYDPLTTPHSFAIQAVNNALALTKPYFLNHTMMVNDWGNDYVMASCYNAMRLGGGIYTLVRLNLKEAAFLSNGTAKDFLNRVIPFAVKNLVEVISQRARFIIEETGWLENDFWIKEGFLHQERFTSYAGIYGLAEAVNYIMIQCGRPEAIYGKSAEANHLAKEITDRVHEELSSLPVLYCDGTQGRVCYHAQVGINTDVAVTPGTRIPSGDEPDLYAHLQAEAPQHRWIEGGASTILEFDQTAASNPQAVLDIIEGAYALGIRNLSIGSASSEFVRVTGYLVRRSDLEAIHDEKAVRHSSSHLASGFLATKPNHLHRRTRTV